MADANLKMKQEALFKNMKITLAIFSNLDYTISRSNNLKHMEDDHENKPNKKRI